MFTNIRYGRWRQLRKLRREAFDPVWSGWERFYWSLGCIFNISVGPIEKGSTFAAFSKTSQSPMTFFREISSKSHDWTWRIKSISLRDSLFHQKCFFINRRQRQKWSKWRLEIWSLCLEEGNDCHTLTLSIKAKSKSAVPRINLDESRSSLIHFHQFEPDNKLKRSSVRTAG